MHPSQTLKGSKCIYYERKRGKKQTSKPNPASSIGKPTTDQLQLIQLHRWLHLQHQVLHLQQGRTSSRTWIYTSSVMHGWMKGQKDLLFVSRMMVLLGSCNAFKKQVNSFHVISLCSNYEMMILSFCKACSVGERMWEGLNPTDCLWFLFHSGTMSPCRVGWVWRQSDAGHWL